MAKEKRNSEVRIRCKVAPGMFSNEWAVTIELPGDRKVTALVDRSAVLVTREPRIGEQVPGQLRVRLLESNTNSLLLELPSPSLVSGSRVEAPRSLMVAAG